MGKNTVIRSMNNYKKDKLIKVERIECIDDKICATVFEDPNKAAYGTPCPVHPV